MSTDVSVQVEPSSQRSMNQLKKLKKLSVQALFSRGEVSSRMHMFLTSRPGEHGLKQAARACDASLSAAHAASAQLHSALQSTTFLLEDLHGLLTASPAYVACRLPVRSCSHRILCMHACKTPEIRTVLRVSPEPLLLHC
jgi:hypothetical protein